MRGAGAAVVLSHNVEVQEDPTFGQQLSEDGSTPQRLDYADGVTIPVPDIETRVIRNLS